MLSGWAIVKQFFTVVFYNCNQPYSICTSSCWSCVCRCQGKEPDSVTVAVKLQKLAVWLASAGSQYCCWNSDSSLVAVSSDFYRAVMVFDVHKKQQVCVQMLSTLWTYIDINVKLCCWSLASCISAEQRVSARSWKLHMMNNCMMLPVPVWKHFHFSVW